jgi:hypothetical protein
MSRQKNYIGAVAGIADRPIDNIPSRHQIAVAGMRPNSLQLLPSQSNQPGSNIFGEKQGIHVKNAA